MKHWFITLFLFLFSCSIHAVDFQEGKHYIKIDRPHEDKTVVKIFSVYCPYCFKYDKSVTPALIKSLPEGTKFEAWSLITKGKYGKEATELLSVLISQNNDESYTKAKMAYYKAVHDDKIEFKSADDFLDFGLKAAGISRDDYNKLVNDPAAVAVRDHWASSIEIAKVQGIPAFVVNGQYLIKTDSITSLDMFNKLVAYLLTL